MLLPIYEHNAGRARYIPLQDYQTSGKQLSLSNSGIVTPSPKVQRQNSISTVESFCSATSDVTFLSADEVNTTNVLPFANQVLTKSDKIANGIKRKSTEIKVVDSIGKRRKAVTK